MGRRNYNDPEYPTRLSHAESAQTNGVLKLLGAIRQTNGREPEVQILPDGSNVVVVDFRVPSQLAEIGYVSRRRE